MSKFLFLTVFLIASVANAQTTCVPDAGYDMAQTTSLENPAQWVTDCYCANWSMPLVIVTDHYHVYLNGVLVSSSPTRAYGFCATAKNFIDEITVYAVSGFIQVADQIVGEPYFTEWVDLDDSKTCMKQVCGEWADAQCLEGDLVVPCP